MRSLTNPLGLPSKKKLLELIQKDSYSTPRGVVRLSDLLKAMHDRQTTLLDRPGLQ